MATEQKSFAKFVFVDTNGADISEPGPDVARMEIRFKDSQFETVSFDAMAVPADTRLAGMWHGFKQKINDFANAASRKLEDAERYEETLGLIERLMADDWLKARESAGPRVSLILEAVVDVLTAAGREVDEKELAELLKDKDERKAAMENPRIKLAYEKIKIARQQARLDKLEAAAADDDSDLPF